MYINKNVIIEIKKITNIWANFGNELKKLNPKEKLHFEMMRRRQNRQADDIALPPE